jgi:hypothetical protein
VRRTERPARRVALAAVVAGAALSFMTAPATAQIAEQVVTFSTVPATPGVRILSGGQIVRTDAGGQVTLTLPAADAGAAERLQPTFTLPRVLGTRLSSGVTARFDGFFHGRRTIGLSLYARTRLRYTRLDGTPVPAGRVRSAELLSSTGVRVRVRGGITPELQATRVVRSGAGLRSKAIEYAVQSVDVGGGNVVHRAQWRFKPVRKPTLTVPLLLYSLRFTSADALFGTPLGSTLSLRYPDGRVEQLPLHDGKAEASGLPRGSYSVRVKAPGYSFARPVSLSRDQVVDVQVISYLDFTVVIGALGVIALTLLFVGRPLLRRRLRRFAAGPLRRARAVARR